jgi:hypothetical protein
LVEDRPLTIGNVVWSPARTRAPIRVTPRVNVPLNLDDAFPARIRKACREHKLIFGIMAPPPVVESTLTCLVPALNEVVVHIGSCRPDNLDIGVVPMALGVTGCSCGSGGQIDPADERHFGRLSCIDQPTLLVMEVVPVRAIPTSPES